MGKKFPLNTIVMILGALGFFFWLYSDKHNDERYVLAANYEKDRQVLMAYIDRVDKNTQDIRDYLLKKNEQVK